MKAIAIITTFLLLLPPFVAVAYCVIYNVIICCIVELMILSLAVILWREVRYIEKCKAIEEKSYKSYINRKYK